MNDRPTPMTDVVWRKHTGFSPQSAADAYELAGNLERQLAAKTEECEGWEKQWREAAMNALTDKTRDELAEVKAQLRIADEQLAIERGALAEAREEIEQLKARIEDMDDDASEINERLEML